jgi:hypothetical protein
MQGPMFFDHSQWKKGKHLERDANNRDEHGNVEAGDDGDDRANEAKDGDSKATSDAADNREEQAKEAAEDVTRV